MSAPVQRKLTTILAADAEGYSRVMEADEVGALRSLRDGRSVFSKFIERHHGRIANTAGDGLLAEFPSVVEAVQCAIEVQHELSATTPEGGLRFRIGVHLGDVIVDGDDLLGEGVNLAARLQTMAPPGGILISRQVYDQVQKKLSVGFSYLGEKQPKNFAESVAVYSVETPEMPPSGGAASVAPPPPQTAAEKKAARKNRPPVDIKSRTIHEATILGAIFAVLLVLDVASGDHIPQWSLWVGLIMAFVFAMRAAPFFARGGFTANQVRMGVIIAAFALINLLSWKGQVWFIYPSAILVVVILIGRLRAGPRT